MPSVVMQSCMGVVGVDGLERAHYLTGSSARFHNATKVPYMLQGSIGAR